MKIFFIIPSLGAGGAERVGVLLAQGLNERGNEVKVFSNLTMRKDYILPSEIELVDIGFSGKNRIFRWIKSVSLIRKYSKQSNPDVVIGIMSLCSLFGYLATIGLGIPVVETIHSSLEKPHYAPMSLWERFYKFYLSKLYDTVTILTEADKKVVDGRQNNVIVMPNPLALVPTYYVVPKTNSIIAAGRLDDWHYKGFDVLIRAWARVVSSLEFQVSTEGWKLQIAGTGSEGSQNYLKQLCKENGVEESVEFLGFRKDVEKLYQDASIFVLSSRYEGFGLVLIEAMSQGCACVACDYKGRQREIIAPKEDESLDSCLNFQDSSVDGQKESEETYIANSKITQRLGTSENPDARLQGTFSERCGERTRNLKLEPRNNKFELCDNGILCEPDDVESLTAGIQKMIEDDEYRENVRKNAIERSKYYSIENTMDRWESLLSQVVNKK